MKVNISGTDIAFIALIVGVVVLAIEVHWAFGLILLGVSYKSGGSKK